MNLGEGIHDSRHRYLELLKHSLTFALWPEPPVPVEAFNFLRSPVKRRAVSFVATLLRRRGLQLVRPVTPSDEERRTGRIWPRYAHTMIGLARLNNLQHCIETVLRENVPGDLIETGVWRGGACILMRGVLAAHGVTDRVVWLADSFSGLPPPDAKQWPADRGDRHHTFAPYLAVSRKEVEQNFERYDLLDAQVRFLEGWFSETLPRAPIERLAVLRLDGDMYGSTMDALVHLYPKLSPGGFCIIDDYGLPGARQAVDDFRTRESIKAELQEIDWSGQFWRKPAAS